MNVSIGSILFLCTVAAETPRATPQKLESAQAELAHADEVRSAMRGKEGEAKVAARKAAVEAYRAVREHWSTDAKACSEAAFHAGELLRSANDAAAALSEFQIARERGKDSPFRVRAGLEIAHIHRRAQDDERALAAYEAVLADAGATPGQRDDASYWEGAVYASAKRLDDARRAWQRVADGGEDPLDRIRAWDGIAGSYVDAGDLEAAAGALERCREATADAAAEETRLGERVRRALASMRAVDDLQRAVEKRDGKKSERKLP
jgi:tetratricopeptide (TPR) repeat protein